MRTDDKPEFGRLLVKAFRFAGKEVHPEQAADWFDEFQGYPLAALDAAFRRHRRESPHPPKPADLYRHLDGGAAADGRPGGDEAWGMLLGLVRDERETGVLSDEMRAAWAVCQPILDAGDAVGARRCFLEVYAREVASARERHVPARWTVTLGTDRRLREDRLRQAVSAGRIGADHARSLLPGPDTSSLEQVAGLLEGSDAPRPDAETAGRLRALAALLRKSLADDEEARRAERERRRAAEAERKRHAGERIDSWLEQPPKRAAG